MFSDFGMTFEHIKKTNRYHGINCLWCNLNNKKRSTDSKKINFPTSLDLSKNGQDINKKGLFIGTNYKNSPLSVQLSGPENDAINLSSFFKNSFHFSECKTIIGSKASKYNIMEGIKWLLKDAKEGDLLFFHYSGHGTQITDFDGNEIDGKDEVLVPDDFKLNGFISDDELFKKLILKVPKNIGLVNIIDTCHSGSMLDLPNKYISKNDTILGQYSKMFIKGNIVSISASQDNQTASDVRTSTTSYGALTNVLMSCIGKRQLRISLSTLLKDMTKELKKAGFSQTPVISTSESIELRKYYFGLTV
jgi:hypothetical protein